MRERKKKVYITLKLDTLLGKNCGREENKREGKKGEKEGVYDYMEGE